MTPSAASALLGNDFSDWAELTEEYAKGMDALRRREPGASGRMMEIARLMNQYSGMVAQQGIPPIPQPQAAHAVRKASVNWFERAVHVISTFELRTSRSDASLSF